MRAELQRILKNGGGIPLAYRLMKDGLYQHTMVLWHAERVAWPLSILFPLLTMICSPYVFNSHTASSSGSLALNYSYLT